MLTVYIIDIKDRRKKHITVRNHLKLVFTLSNLPKSLLQKIERTNGGKMMADDYYINITYADDYAFVMITKQKFGIDAEKIKQKDNNMKLILSSILSLNLKNDLDFYKAWTTMESEVKYYGDKGLFDALEGNIEKNAFLKTIHLMYNGNIIAITSTKNNLEAQEILLKKCQDETI